MVTRAEVVNGFTALFDSPNYLEVGVSAGETFASIKAAKKVAVDPFFQFDTASAKRAQLHSHFYEVESDHYFANQANAGDLFQVIYLDGLHTFEQTLRDLTNSLRYLDLGGVIVIDDVLPNSYASSLPDHSESVQVRQFLGDSDNSWMGDTYKVIFFAHTFIPSLTIRTVRDNHGQSVLWHNSKARVGFEPYSVKDLAELQYSDVVRRQDVFCFATAADITSEFEAVREQAS